MKMDLKIAAQIIRGFEKGKGVDGKIPYSPGRALFVAKNGFGVNIRNSISNKYQ